MIVKTSDFKIDLFQISWLMLLSLSGGWWWLWCVIHCSWRGPYQLPYIQQTLQPRDCEFTQFLTIMHIIDHFRKRKQCWFRRNSCFNHYTNVWTESNISNHITKSKCLKEYLLDLIVNVRWKKKVLLDQWYRSVGYI